MQDNQEVIYSLKDVAKLLNISVKTLKIRVTAGKFKQPDSRKDGELFWNHESLRGLIAESVPCDDFDETTEF